MHGAPTANAILHVEKQLDDDGCNSNDVLHRDAFRGHTIGVWLYAIEDIQYEFLFVRAALEKLSEGRQGGRWRGRRSAAKKHCKDIP